MANNSFQIRAEPTGRSFEKSVTFEEPHQTVANPFKTVKKQQKEESSPSRIDLIPTREDVHNDVFASDEIHKMYHDHLRKKEGFRLRIEQKQREKAFIEDLTPQDYVYYKQKTDELAIKERYERGFEEKEKPTKTESNEPKKFRDLSPDARLNKIHNKVGEINKDQTFRGDVTTTMDFRECAHTKGNEIIKTLDETRLTGEQKRILDRQREDLKTRREKDLKYRQEIDLQNAKIPDERLLELQKKVEMLIRENSQQCMHGHSHAHEGEVDFDAKTEFFHKRMYEFIEHQHDSEDIRHHSQHMLHEMQIMEHYLVEEKDRFVSITGGKHSHSDVNEDRDNDLFHKIGEQLHIKEDRSKYWKPEYDDFGARKFNVNIHDILPFSDINEGVVKDQWEFGRKIHNSKIHNFQNKKKYQYWLEDDEEDIEAQKIYSDIKNLQQEKYFNLYFNYDREVDDFLDNHNRKEGEEKLITLEKTIKEKQKWNRNTKAEREFENNSEAHLPLHRAETALPGKIEKQTLSSLHY